MGIGYEDSIVLYNRYVNGVLETEYYVGTRFDNVRIELTQGANIKASGIENADACVVKIPNDNTLIKPYMPPEVWNDQTTEIMEQNFTIDTASHNFFVIVKKQELGIELDLPVGLIESDKYRGGFFQYIKEKYGHAYVVDTLNVYTLIPRFEIGGK